MSDQIGIDEAATIKGRALAALRALNALLADKELPSAVVEQVQSLRATMRRTWQDLADEAGDDEVQEAAQELTEAGDPLAESGAVSADGYAKIKIIRPGWGSSGYYPAEVLRRDAGVFAAGTKMYWDHPSLSEDRERPERSLRDLAAELVGPAVWMEDGPTGPGLYADVKVFEQYRNSVDELAPHIGVSIRALGVAKPGEAEGRKGPVIEKIAAARSVDFVTTPGAGGEILRLFEAARAAQTTTEEVETVDVDAMKAKIQELEAQLAALKTENESLSKANAELKQGKEQAETEAARMREAKLVADGNAVISEALAAIEMPEPTRKRLGAQLGGNLPLSESGELDVERLRQAVTEAAQAELRYIAEAAGAGKIRGFGSAAQSGAQGQTPNLEEAFKRMGLTESAAKIAAGGR